MDITVGTSFDAVGEALASGSADVGFLPSGTYVLYDKEVDVLLTATRDNLLKDSSNPKTGMMEKQQNVVKSKPLHIKV